MIQQRHHLNSSQSMKHSKRNESGRQDGPRRAPPPPFLEAIAGVCLAELDVRGSLFGMWEFKKRVPRWPNHITGAILRVKLSLSI